MSGFTTTVGGLLAEAERETGLDDFGDDSFRDGLERLVSALTDEARLNDLGELVLAGKIGAALSQRLQIESWYLRHPEIDDEVVRSPLIGLGLPRTGSTALSHLLAQDPHARSLLWWEAEAPCPPPATVEGEDPRVVQATESDARSAASGRPPSRLELMVPVSALGPAECQDLMALDFKSQVFQAYAQIPSYSHWLLHEADLRSTYHYEKRALKLLQWGGPDRPWRLKAPTHVIYLDALDDAFPDARFWMTHREPVDVLVSVADLYAEVAAMFSDTVDLEYLGALNVEQWSVGMERAMHFRAAGREARFYDIAASDMQRRPIEEVKGLYRWLGEPVGDEFETAMATWWREHAESRQQADYRPAEAFGIDPPAARRLFAAYTERFVPTQQG